MPEISKSNDIYKDWNCEELFRANFSSLMELDELLLKLNYSRISNQKELFNFLNFLLIEKFPHRCYNEFCDNKLHFSNTLEFAIKHLNLTLKEFVKIWITPHTLGKLKVRSIEILFFCCKCYETKLKD